MKPQIDRGERLRLLRREYRYALEGVVADVGLSATVFLVLGFNYPEAPSWAWYIALLLPAGLCTRLVCEIQVCRVFRRLIRDAEREGRLQC